MFVAIKNQRNLQTTFHVPQSLSPKVNAMQTTEKLLGNSQGTEEKLKMAWK